MNNHNETQATLITHEPPYDAEPYYTGEDIHNLGYGFRDLEVSEIKDPRMLINFYLFLQKDSTKEYFERSNRDHAIAVHKTCYALLISVGSNCTNIVVELGDSGLFVNAMEAAGIILENAFNWGTDRFDFNKVRKEIEKLVDGMQFYYYGHIESNHYEK